MSLPPARASKAYYRRNLPHIQRPHVPLFITFDTWDRWVLPEGVRDRVLQHCLHDNGTKLRAICVVVMPDHVHMIATLLKDQVGDGYSLGEVMNGIKGASSHSVNRMLARRGTVWQDESYDHVLRDLNDVVETITYLRQNPVRRKLVTRAEDYRWFWLDESSLR